DFDAASPARFNADATHLFEASGCAGKLIVFAVRLDTFPSDPRNSTFYIGTNNPDQLTQIRRRFLTESIHLPISAEYIHRTAFQLAERFGKDLFLLIRRFGTDRLPVLFALQYWSDRIISKIPFAPDNLTDRLLQTVANLAPQHLPKRMTEFRDR